MDAGGNPPGQGQPEQNRSNQNQQGQSLPGQSQLGSNQPYQVQPVTGQPSPYVVVNHPEASDRQLGHAARQAPELQPQVAAHPSASNALLQWLVQNGTPEGRQAAAQALSARGFADGYGAGGAGVASGYAQPSGQGAAGGYGQPGGGSGTPGGYAQTAGGSGGYGGQVGSGGAGGPGGPGSTGGPSGQGGHGGHGGMNPADLAGAYQSPSSRKGSGKTGLIIGLVAGGVVVLLGLILGGIFLARWIFASSDSGQTAREDSPAVESSESSDAGSADSGIPNSSGTVELVTSQGLTVDVPIEASQEGILVGFPEAPVTLDYYFDFSCPHCVNYHDAMGEAFQASIADGDVQVSYHMINFVSEYGVLAGAATAATVQYEPEDFFVVMDALFAIPSDDQYGMSQADYAAAVADAGVDSADALAVIESGNYEDWIRANTERARADGVGGTPWLVMDGEQVTTLPTTADELRSLVK